MELISTKADRPNCYIEITINDIENIKGIERVKRRQKMKKVLILTEKRSVNSHISKALKNVSDDITITEIGGHIYTTDEPFVVPLL